MIGRHTFRTAPYPAVSCFMQTSAARLVSSSPSTIRVQPQRDATGGGRGGGGIGAGTCGGGEGLGGSGGADGGAGGKNSAVTSVGRASLKFVAQVTSPRSQASAKVAVVVADVWIEFSTDVSGQTMLIAVPGPLLG